MPRTLSKLPLILLLLTTFTLAQNPTSKIDQRIDTFVADHTHVQQFITNLQQAVARHDAAAVAALISYPIKINPGTKPLTISTPQAFIKNYENIITPAIAGVIENQKYDRLFVRDEGAMFGEGEVWIAGICRNKPCTQPDPKVVTIQTTDHGKK
jgi:hypothetical protein